MSRLEELLQTLCPDGVELIPLCDVASIDKGEQLNLTKMTANAPYPVMNGGIKPSGFYEKYNTTENTIAISQGGASAGFVNFVNTKFWAGAHCYIVRPKTPAINNKYLYYFLKNSESEIQNSKYGAGIPGLNKSTLDRLNLPIPPLPVQEEIVRILDTFSSTVAELEQKLNAERAARTKQYEHYRNELLSFDSNSRIMEKLLTDYSLNGVEFKNLGEICNVTTGKLNANAMKDDGKYPFFTCAREVYRIDNYAFNTEALLVSGNGSQVGHIHYYNGKFNAYQRTYVLDKFTENISYIRHVLRAFLKQRILEEVNVSGVPYIKLDTLTDFLIPIPPREIQDQIVSILDRFDTLVNDLKSGLPAEIALRRKQYETYRDTLLTFTQTN